MMKPQLYRNIADAVSTDTLGSSMVALTNASRQPRRGTGGFLVAVHRGLQDGLKCTDVEQTLRGSFPGLADVQVIHAIEMCHSDKQPLSYLAPYTMCCCRTIYVPFLPQ